MVRLPLLIMNLYYCAGFLQVVDLPGDPKRETLPDDDDAGEPLFLTPYIENGQFEEARNLSLVKLHRLEHIESYSGLLTVDKTYNTNLFFWYFPANGTSPSHQPKSAEVIIYLTNSFFTDNVHSLNAVFEENGPIRLIKGRRSIYAEEREWSLHKYRHVIYIDHAPGVGFSFTDDFRGYPDSSKKIGELLYTATLQIFKLFPVLQSKYLSIMGEMVAAKYATMLAYYIDKNKSTAEIDIKLQRLHLTSPWIDPINQVGYYHEHAYDVGLIDGHTSESVLHLQNMVQHLIITQQWTQALSLYMILYRELIRVTSRDYLSNFSADKKPGEIDFGNELFNWWIYFKNNRRKALHVGSLRYQSFAYTTVGWDALKNDFMQSVQHELSVLARKDYIILLANGPLSILVPFRAMYDTMKNIDDRTYIVDEMVIVDLANKTYQAYVYMGALGSSQTIAVLQQKVGNFPWIDQPEMTWNVVDLLHDVLPLGNHEEDGYNSLSERLVQTRNTDKKGKFNPNFWGTTQSLADSP